MLLSFFRRCGNWGRLWNVTKVTLLVNYRAGFQTRPVRLYSSFSHEFPHSAHPCFNSSPKPDIPDGLAGVLKPQDAAQSPGGTVEKSRSWAPPLTQQTWSGTLEFSFPVSSQAYAAGSKGPHFENQCYTMQKFKDSTEPAILSEINGKRSTSWIRAHNSLDLCYYLVCRVAIGISMSIGIYLY